MVDDGRDAERRACGAPRCGEVECGKYLRMATSRLKGVAAERALYPGPYGQSPGLARGEQLNLREIIQTTYCTVEGEVQDDTLATVGL